MYVRCILLPQEEADCCSHSDAKPGKDSTHVERLRPISHLSAMSKVFECLMQHWVQDHLGILDVLTLKQFDFCKTFVHSSAYEID